MPECLPLDVEYPSEPLAFQSVAVGVGRRRTAALSTSPPPRATLPLPRARFCVATGVGSLATTSASGLEFFCAVASPVSPLRQSRAVGVGSDRTVTSSDGRNGPVRPAAPPWFEPYGCAVGVGSEQIDPLAVVRGSEVRGRLKQRRSPLEAHPANVLENRLGPVQEVGNVLDENERRLAASHDANELRPERPVVPVAAAQAGPAVRLAGDARSDAIHDAAPRSRIEGSEVRPDRSRSQRSRSHLRDQDRGGECFPLHVSDAARSGLGDLEPELQPSDPGT